MRPITTRVAVILTCGLLGGLATSWAQPRPDADGATRLTPATFADAPPSIRQALADEACRIPQAWGHEGPHNIIQGAFATAEQTDWAALCSRNGASEVLLFWGGPIRCPPLPGPRQDSDYLRETAGDGQLFARALASVPAGLLAQYWTSPDARSGTTPTHDAIADAVQEGDATAFYCDNGRWVTFVAG